MKNFVAVLIFLFIGFLSFAQEKKWTLRECVQHALENNISVKQSALDIDLADIEKSDANGNFLPTLNGTASVSKSTGLSFNPTTGNAETATFLSATGRLDAGYTIFDGLRNFRQSQRADLSKLAAQYRLSKMQDDISLFVANGYLQILLNKANLQVIKAQNEVTLQQIERTNELVDAGVLPRGDLLDIRASNASELQQIAIAENALTISKISLAQLLLVEDYANFDIADEEFTIIDEGISAKGVSEIIEAAKENRSEVKIAEKSVEIAEKDLQIAKGAYFPTLSAFFGYDTRYTDTDPLDFIDQLYLNDGINYGLRLSVPFLNGFSVRNNVRRSKVGLLRNQFQLEQAKLDLESNVYQAYVDAKGALRSYEAAQAAAESQELAYNYAQQRFDVGLTNAFDFSQSKLRYDNAQIELNRAKYDYIFKLKVLELYFGVPATELKF